MYALRHNTLEIDLETSDQSQQRPTLFQDLICYRERLSTWQDSENCPMQIQTKQEYLTRKERSRLLYHLHLRGRNYEGVLKFFNPKTGQFFNGQCDSVNQSGKMTG